MASKSGAGASFGPLFIRIGLGLVFMWAGLGKVLTTSVVSGEDVALLAEMGITAENAAPLPPSVTPASPKGSASFPTPDPAPRLRPVSRLLQPKELEVSGAYTLALMLKKAAPPEADASKALWPAALAKGRYPVYAAYACVLTELVGGALLLVGALTRFWAAGLALVMLNAIWLTQVGPAVRAGDALLGFLPRHAPFDSAWQPLVLQCVLLCCAVALVLMGCGRLGLDRLLFPRSGGPPARSRPEPAA